MVLIIVAVLTMAGCAGYQFGDISTYYCTTDNKALQAQFKATLKENGVDVGVDYCTARGFIRSVYHE